jgi:hypothetical protein
MVRKFLDDQGLTFRGAGFKSSVSAAYWKDMSDGRVPSEEMISKMAESFKELDENELRLAAGYAPVAGNVGAVKAVEFALRSQDNISDEGKKQILDFVKKIEKKYEKQA